MTRLGRIYRPDERDYALERIHPDHASAPLPPRVLWADAVVLDQDAIREWLAFHGPVVFGTDWTNDMFNPDPSGFVRPTGGVAGGHCFLCIGYDTANDSFRFRNSWGPTFGLGGDFLVRSADVTTLLKGIESPGEACVADELPLIPPAPVPIPPPVPPAPLPPDLEERLKRALEKAIRAVLHEIFGS